MEEGEPHEHGVGNDERKEEGELSGHGGKFSYFLTDYLFLFTIFVHCVSLTEYLRLFLI